MTTRWPCVVVTMLCCLLAVATSASPSARGCTLWAHTSGEVNGVPVSPGGSWDSVQAAQSERDCEVAANTAADATLGYLKGKFEASGFTITAEGTTVLMFWADAKGQRLSRLRHLCLPDTVDPRGRSRE